MYGEMRSHQEGCGWGGGGSTFSVVPSGLSKLFVLVGPPLSLSDNSSLGPQVSPVFGSAGGGVSACAALLVTSTLPDSGDETSVVVAVSGVLMFVVSTLMLSV